MEKFYLDARMRNFVYRSGAKIPMLYEQIELPLRKKIAASLKIALPGVAVGLQQREALPSEHEMLRMVLHRLDDAGLIGTIDESRPYVAGRLRFRWAKWKEFGYLGGREHNTVLGLAFSMQHVTHPPGIPPLGRQALALPARTSGFGTF